MKQLSSDSLCIYPLIFPAFEKKEEHASYSTRGTTMYREISLKIFKELGFQDLCQAKLICREWKQLIESSALAEDIFRIGLKLAIQKNNPMRENVCAEKLVQEVYCIEKLGDIYQEKGTAETLLQAAGLYNYALQIVSDDKKKFFEEKLLKAQHLLINVCQGKVLDNNRIRKEFKGNRQALKKFREEIEEKIQLLSETPSFQEVKELYGKIALDIKAFFSLLVNQAIDVLGPAPCEYAMIGFGSLAREEMTPYSDLEFGILIKEDNDAHKKYFRNLTNLIHLKVINLGETILPALNIPCLKAIDFFDGITPRGFAFDGAGVEGKGCKTPFGNSKTFELIQTPEKMAQYIAKNEEGHWWHEKEPHLPMELLTFVHLIGNPGLTRQYGEKLQEKLIITYHEGLNLRQYLAKQHLVLADMEAFDPRMGDLSRQGMLFKVKNDLYRFPHLALDRLALLKKVEASNTFTRIDELNKLGIIKNNAAVKLSEWMSIALFMRLKTYSHYQAQQEMMNPLIKPFGFENPELIKKQFALDLGTLEKIKKIYRTFIPFYQTIEEFLTGTEDSLNSSDLEDNSLETQGSIALRLFQKEEAKKCFKLARKENPSDPYILGFLGSIYEASGNLDKAANYAEKALQISLDLLDENYSFLIAIYYNLRSIDQKQCMLEQTAEHTKRVLTINSKHFENNQSRIATIFNTLGTIYREQGNLKLAVKYTNLALAIKLKLLGENHPEVAICYNSLGLIYKDQGYLKQAIEYAKKALIINRKLFGESHLSIAKSYNNLGAIYDDQGNLDKAAEYAKKALVINLKLFGESHPHIAENYNNLGTIYHKQGNLGQAAECTRKALVINRKLFGKNHPSIAKFYNNLGIICDEQGDLKRAVEYSNKALTINLKLFGENYPITAENYNNLGAIYYRQGNLNQAADYTKKALSINIKLFGESHSHIAENYNNLGTIYHEQSNLKQAAEYVKKALAINLELFGETHPYVATIYHNLGALYEDQGNLDMAAEYVKKSLAIDLKLFGENNPTIAKQYIILGKIYREQGNLEQAVEFFEKALIVTRKALGENHPTVAIIYNNVGKIYQEQGMLESAAEYIKRALAIDLKFFGRNHPHVAAIYNNLGTIYHNQYNLEKATRYVKKALTISVKLFGENHRYVAAIYNNLGQIYKAQDNLREALEHSQKAFDINLKLVGENHPTMAICYNNLGQIYTTQGNIAKAVEYFNKALAIDLDIFGENHSNVARDHNNLKMIYPEQGKLNKAAGIYQYGC
ncbi:tetratricopeptide repeat protein [Neochlamydia sp. AcF84]|uniref:tetratricopeptide repeat protein n=1 Tax=Neochlamydia sp. AcF84 TaxID=2315858 RepID=UPI00140AD050|nr:tetratricopeptide repeat protein [Neochlamydia sp. AcF84]